MSAQPPFHLAFPVHDLEVARKFYGELLECREGRSAARWVDFDFFGHQLVAHLAPTLVSGSAASLATNAVDGDAVPVRHFGAVLEMWQWERLADRLTRAKTDFLIEPHVRFSGQPGEQATLFFLDPSGNALEFKAFAHSSQIFATDKTSSEGSEAASPRLRTARTLVRLAHHSDAPEVLRYWTDTGSRYERPPAIGLLNLERQSQSIARAQRRFSAKEALLAFVFKPNERAVIGSVHLTSMVGLPFSSAQLGYAIDAAHEGQGVMSEAVSAVIQYGFDELNLHRITAFHELGNVRSARLLERLGFEAEGLRKAHALNSRGEWVDHRALSLINANWNPSP